MSSQKSAAVAEPGSIPGRKSRNKKLDFIIIGAPKCGTTSLHRYLECHPELYMLPEKEVPYFTNEEYYQKGWDWYADEFFAQAPATKLWGKSSPQYIPLKQTAVKIYEEMPQTKLIALLRNPIERAYSHYKMHVKRGIEPYTFSQAVDECLQPEYLKRRFAPQEKGERRYFFGGEYGRMVEQYYEVFPKDQMLVLFTEDLKNQPETVFKQVLRFLGVDETFVPKNLGRQYHLGGTKRKIPMSEFELQRNFLFRAVVKLMMTKRARHRFERRFLFWYMIWNTKPDPTDPPLPVEARKKLADFYRDDVAKLNKILGRQAPWADFADL